MKESKRKRKSSQKTFFSTDGRWSKIIAITCLLVAVYLGIAFFSYLYTWRQDQDKVLEFSLRGLFEGGIHVDNWLGRLGAYLSNLFFYWGFGLPSLTVVFLLSKLGIDILKKKSLKYFPLLTAQALVFMAFFSMVLDFTFKSSDFTWGGAFGESTALWMSNFIGQIGLSLFILFSVATFIIWRFNPNLQFVTDGFGNWNTGNTKVSFVENMVQKFKSATALKEDINLEADNAEPLSHTNDNLFQHRKELLKEDKKETNEVVDDFEIPVNPENKRDTEILTPKATHTTANAKSDLDIEILDREAVKDNEEKFDMLSSIAKEDQNRTPERGTGPYDPTLDLSGYKAPTLDLLIDYEDQNTEIDRAELEANKDQIIETLLNYKIEITKIRATIGPTVTLYEIVPAPGVKISKIKNLEDDIALSLAALGIRIIAPIPGKGTIGIEVPNKTKQIVSLKEVLNSDKFQTTKMALPIALGKTISNEVFVADLAKMPHLLVAGATGQGKSVGINAILMSLLYKKHPSEVKLVLIDPKKVELFPYSSLEKHFLAVLPDQEEPIITETSKVVNTLNSLCVEMDTRYDLLKAARARNLTEYNQKFKARKLNPNEGHKFLPYIVLVIDEFADLMMTAGKEVELPIARLAQLARAIGIHLIIATQRPSVNIITGIIKANFPARLAFKVTSKIDSRTILDAGGADQLIGRGDMLLSVGSNVIRLQCAFVDTPEVESVIDHIDDQQGYPEPFYLPEFSTDEGGGNGTLSWSDLDENFEEAAQMIVSSQHGSTSSIQRKMQLGYNRAGRIMDQMEQLGIVGPSQGSKPREVLFHTVSELDEYLTTLKNS
jgi:S-DNA-T family DNA segregation ATPase FtsK/SpoIIIE